MNFFRFFLLCLMFVLFDVRPFCEILTLVSTLCYVGFFLSFVLGLSSASLIFWCVLICWFPFMSCVARGSVPKLTPHQYWDVCGSKKNPQKETHQAKLSSLSSNAHTSEVRKTILPTVAKALSKGGKASFRPSELFTKQRGTQTK